MKILNIHGYKGSAENSACLVLKNLGHDVISPQLNYDSGDAQKIYEKLQKIHAENGYPTLVGTSLGGFFALALAMHSSSKCILVNPCLCPFITLPELDYKGDIISYMEIFWDFADIYPKKDITAIIGGQDEVISYHSFTKNLIKNHIVIPEGKHSGATLNLEEIFRRLIQ